MLTVMRDMAAHVASRLAHMDAPRLGPDAEGDEQQRVLADILEEAIVAGEASVRRGPELLPVLREAGVVDAGGYGVIVIFAGVVAALRGEAAPRARAPRAGAHQPSRARLLDLPLLHELRRHRRRARRRALRRRPGGARRLRARRRRSQHAEGPRPHRRSRDGDRGLRRRRARCRASTWPTCAPRSPSAMPAWPTNGHSAGARTGVLAVVSGAGMARLYESLGAHVLDGGPTLNPSTHELLAGIHAVPSEEVVVLPNSANVIMAAERAAELAEKAVRVVASTLAAGRAGRRRGADPGRRRRRQRRRHARGHRRGAHRRRGARRARRRRRALRRGRCGRLRRGRARGLGRDRRRRSRRCSPRWRPTPSS